MITLLSHAALIILALITLLWIWSVFIKNVSIVDIFWGFGFVVVNVIYAYMSGELNARKILILTLVSIWGIRLVIYLAIRISDIKNSEEIMGLKDIGGLVFFKLFYYKEF
jgi:steroid 5-alpha reductase family enzyme